MWLLYAVGSALFAGLTSILAKCGIRKTDSTVATAIRTIIVLVFAWVMVFVVGSQGTIASIPARSLVFLGLSGLATGASWLCYFYALQRGPIDKVVPIDKSSTVMTILLAALLLGESVTLTRGIGVVLIAAGTFLMIEKKGGVRKEESGWMLAAFGSAIFAARPRSWARSASPGSSPISVRRCAPAWCSSWRGSWCLCRASKAR